MHVASALGVALVVLAPWAGRNVARFDRVLLSTNDGTAIAGANCPATYDGPHPGGFDLACVVVPHARGGNEAERFGRLRDQGIAYARDHAARVPVIAAIHVGTLWGVWEPGRQVHVTGRSVTVQRVGVVVYYLVALLGIAGAWALRRRHVVLAILLAPAAVATVAALATFGNTRLRHGAEVVLLALAGVACARLSAHRCAAPTVTR